MVFLIVLLTLALILDSVILVMLVLIQLPKKEAGGVLAFGAGGADALFGAGSGTMLTKITKYAATAFFILAIIVSLMQSAYHNRNTSAFQESLGKTRQPAPSAVPPATTPATPQPLSTPQSLTSTTATPMINTSTPAIISPAAESTNLTAPTNVVPPPK